MPVNSVYFGKLKMVDILIEYNRIHKLHYDERVMNCEIKTYLFTRFLLEGEVGNVNIVRIQHEDRENEHIFVVWDMMVFDPTGRMFVYNRDYDEYVTKLRKLGFTGKTTVKTFNTLEELETEQIRRK